MSSENLEEKYKNLQEILQELDCVAVAFSGGVDSTFLLYAATKVLPVGKVFAFFADSPLVPNPAQKNAVRIFEQYFENKVVLKKVDIDPLTWQDLILNPVDRCYLCKNKIYSIFLSEIKKMGVASLLDGTNTDDLNQDRPGHKAIRELGVLTPLAQAGLSKFDIRRLAKSAGLDNYALPSNSCLATRVECGTPLSADMLQKIDLAEVFLNEKGFPGCRVRPLGKKTIVEVCRNDIKKIVLKKTRLEIRQQFKLLGLGAPVLDLEGRPEPFPKKYTTAKKQDIIS